MWKQQVLLLREMVERLPDTLEQKESKATFFPTFHTTFFL